MPEFFLYFIKLSVALSIVYFFYVVALRRLTFYNWNRWYLLLYTGLCFLFPLIDIGSLFSSATPGNNNVIAFVPTLSDFNKHVEVSNTATSFFTVWNIIAVVLLEGMVFLLLRLLIQLYSYSRMARKATLISVNGIWVYETDVLTSPFSFGRSVFINPQQHTEEELAEIIKHEFVHVKQAHTIDVLWGELLCIVNWYNPFAWLLRNAIRQNLEFIADNNVLENGIDRKQYQYLLLKVVAGKHYRIAHSFNISSLKKRIAMMNKSKSAQLQLVRFLFILPVVILVLLVFRKETIAQELSDNKKKVEEAIKEAIKKRIEDHVKNDTVVPLQVREVTLVPLPQDLINYQKNVKDVSIKGDIITVFLQDGKKEQYDLTDEKQKQVLEKKYGKMPNTSVVTDTIPKVPVKEVILEPRQGESIGGGPVSQSYKADTVTQQTWPQFSQSYSNWQQWEETSNRERREFSLSDEVSFSMKGSPGNGISYVEPTKEKKRLTIDKAIITAESISINSKDRSLTLHGDASFKNEDGVMMYATTIQLRLKELSSIPYILLNNKELEWDKDYSSNVKQRYEISYLNKEEALQKYGEKAKEGALEINSL